MRHYALGGKHSIEWMALLLSCFEATTLLPSQLALIYSFLLRKAKGGYRVINLLAGPYRLWVRARRVQ
eukprot:6697106-Lingulodinium_polyedra.AAC.1